MNILIFLTRINLFVTILYIYWAIVPYIHNNLSRMFVFFVLVLWMITTMLILLLEKAKLHLLSFITIFWLLELYFYYYTVADVTAIGNLYNGILFYFPLLMLSFYISKNKIKYLKYIIIFTFIAIFIYVTDNIIIIMEDPLASKYYTGGVEYTLEKYFNSNLGSLEYVITTTLFIPCLLCFSRYLKKFTLKTVSFFLLILIFFYIIIASSLICVIIMILEITAIIIYKNKYIAIIILTIIGGFLIFVCYEHLTSNHFDLYSFVFNFNPGYAERIKIIEEYFMHTSSLELISRLSLMKQSIDTFLSNPIFGIGMIYAGNSEQSLIGMHSQFFDDLVRYGINGLMTNIIIYISYIRIVLINMESITYKEFFILTILASLFCSIFNIFHHPGNGVMLFFIVPICMVYLNNIYSNINVNEYF